ncbi:Uncharacterized protein SAMN05446635_6816 [Burkholderia sp. OK233]|nr:Uncharacterized protein SAMN05446635_6816 [Burkholderia sp. OK233]
MRKLLSFFAVAADASLARFGHWVIPAMCACVTATYAISAGATDVQPKLAVSPAEQTVAALSTAMLGAATAGHRIVSVGDHGAILLSDDGGHHFRQARFVPIGSMLTSVSFANATTGWAVGQWGAILQTKDGGETWKLQRVDMANDQPLFSVYFKDQSEGWAVGLWSLMLHTTDGGANWQTVTLPAAPGHAKADLNLYSIFGDGKGALFASAEKGQVLRSLDGGVSWSYADTGYTGSLWTGIRLSDGTLLVAGLRGSILRSSDNGTTWTNVPDQFHSSINSIVQLSNGTVVALGLDGVSLVSKDSGQTFVGSQRPDRLPLLTATETKGANMVVFSESGPQMQ